jgi:hypothetical protein
MLRGAANTEILTSSLLYGIRAWHEEEKAWTITSVKEMFKWRAKTS